MKYFLNLKIGFAYTLVYTHQTKVTVSKMLFNACTYADIDECLFETCADNATCMNTDGSFLCLCDPGFTGDGDTNCSSKPPLQAHM